MGEIKSTLDLVMERTKHLTMSPEEKRQQEKEAFKKQVKGLIQKYRDGVLTKEDVGNQLETLKSKHEITGNQELMEVLGGEIQLEDNWHPIKDLMEAFCHVTGSGIESVIRGYESEVRDKATQFTQRLKERWATEQGISGSAVLPNPVASAEWIQEAFSIRQHYQRQLESELASLTAAAN